MDTYNRVVKVVVPKRAALKESEAQLLEVMAALKIKQHELADVRVGLGVCGFFVVVRGGCRLAHCVLNSAA